MEETWNAHIKEVVEKVKEYKNEVAIKIYSLNSLSSYEEKMLALEREKLEFQKQQAELQSKERELEASRIKLEGFSKAKAKLTAFHADYDSLVSQMNEGLADYAAMTDQEVSDAMQNLSKVEKVVARIVRCFLDYEQLVTVHGEEHAGTLEVTRSENKRVKEWFASQKENLEE